MHPGRRILKLLRTTAVVLSTLLFLAAMGMWGRSYWRVDDVENIRASGLSVRFFRILSERAHLSFSWTQIQVSEASEFGPVYRKTWPHGWQWETFGTDGPPSKEIYSLLGFGYSPLSHRQFSARLSISGRSTRVPYWFIALLSLPLPLLALRRWRRERRIAREGLCPVCGYDLRASPDRCPECGTSIGTPRQEIRVDT
jgi:hypothetical protein